MRSKTVQTNHFKSTTFATIPKILMEECNLKVRSFKVASITIKPTYINCSFMATFGALNISSTNPFGTSYRSLYATISSLVLPKFIGFGENTNILNPVHIAMMNKGRKIFKIKK